jgi:hypothetical protein
MMQITEKERAEIRAYYKGQYTLKFSEDGSVLAKKIGSHSWGILYFPWYTERHLKYIREKKQRL